MKKTGVDGSGELGQQPTGKFFHSEFVVLFLYCHSDVFLQLNHDSL